MSFFDKITAFLPLRKKEEKKEYFFAVNIENEQITVALWAIEGKTLNVLEIAAETYSGQEEIIQILDKLLDQIIGSKEIDPQKILFGVPNSWILDDNLKEDKLKILRDIVKELELSPMAYVSDSNALAHLIERQEGVPATAVLVGFEKEHATVAVVRAGKMDGVKVIKRGDSVGSDIEKGLLQFADVETLPSRILIYGMQTEDLKTQLLSFPWMSKLSFLHFPKIDLLGEDILIKSICLAGASEINNSIVFVDQAVKKDHKAVLEKEIPSLVEKEEKEEKEETDVQAGEKEDDQEVEEAKVESDLEKEDFGFVAGDISKQIQKVPEVDEIQKKEFQEPLPEPEETFEADKPKIRFDFKKFIPGKLKVIALPIAIIFILLLLLLPYLFISKANIKIFVEPKVLEKDATVIADPNQKTVNENDKIIPAQIVEVEVSGSVRDTASGKKQIGDPAKGTVIIYNKTSESKSLGKGTQIVNSGGLKFTLDSSINIASQSATESGITFGKVSSGATASVIGGDGNLPSGTTFSVGNYGADKVSAKAEGNFSGGTSKDVTVVSSEDTQRLLAKLSSDLKQQAQQKLQEKYQGKKILKEALSENIKKKSYSKNINDQASEFSLNMTVAYKGTAFEDADLKTIVSKLVTLEVPSDFQLNLSETETQADVSKLEKDGKLIFLARFKAKLMPKIEINEVKEKIRFKTITQAQEIIKNMENILSSDIKLNPNLPGPFSRIPLLQKNITVDVGLK